MKIHDLSRKQLDHRFEAMKRLAELAAPPAKGWIRAIRDALGMTTTQLARRMGVSQPRIMALEAAERDKTTSLQSLEKAAAALDCSLIYALVPHTSLAAQIDGRAEKKAAKMHGDVHHTMMLENQVSMPGDRRALIEKIKSGKRSQLWDEE